MDFIKEQIKKKRNYLNKSTRNAIQLENLLVKKNLIQKITQTSGFKKKTHVETCDKIYEALLASSQINPQDFISCLKESQNAHLLPCFFKPEVAGRSKQEQNEALKEKTESPSRLPLFYLLIGSLTQLKVFSSFYPLDTNLLTTIKLKYTKVDCTQLQKCLQGCLALKSLLLDNISVSKKPSKSIRPHLPNIKEYIYSELLLTQKKSKSSSAKKQNAIWQDFILFDVTKGDQLTFEDITSRQINILVNIGEQILLWIDYDQRELVINDSNENNMNFKNLGMLFPSIRNISLRNFKIDIDKVTQQSISNISDLTLHNLQISTVEFHALMSIPNRIKVLKLAVCPQLTFDFTDVTSFMRSLAIHDIKGVKSTLSQPPKTLALDSLLISNTFLDPTVSAMFSKALTCNRIALGQHLKPKGTALELLKNLVVSNNAKAEWLLVWIWKSSTLEGIANCLVPGMNFKKGHPIIFEMNLSSQLEERTIGEKEATEIIMDMLDTSNFSNIQ